MESTLFTTLTATEEASLSGGTKWYKKPVKKDDKKPTPTTPTTPAKIVPDVNIAVVAPVQIILGGGKYSTTFGIQTIGDIKQS